MVSGFLPGSRGDLESLTSRLGAFILHRQGFDEYLIKLVQMQRWTVPYCNDLDTFCATIFRNLVSKFKN